MLFLMDDLPLAVLTAYLLLTLLLFFKLADVNDTRAKTG